jgi:hypothetical protein
VKATRPFAAVLNFDHFDRADLKRFKVSGMQPNRSLAIVDNRADDGVRLRQAVGQRASDSAMQITFDIF